MMMKQPKNKYIKTPHVYLYVVHCKDITQRYLPMVKQEQAKLIQWKDLDIICMMMKEVLFLELSRIFLDIFNRAKMKM